MNKIDNIEDIMRFLFAGNTTITLKSEKSGNHYTYKVRVAKKDDITAPFFVSVLTGLDNYSSYSYIGILSSDKKSFRLTQKSKVNKDAISFKAFDYFFKQIMKNELNDDLSVYHEGVCGRCGRKLTTPRSIEIGLGPICEKKVNKLNKLN